MEPLKEMLPFLAPVVALELFLVIVAVRDLIRRERTKGPKWAWALAMFVGFFGPIAYLLFGREE